MKFYPADYLLATRSLTDTEKSVWMDLLCFMWLKPEDRGWIESHREDLARMVGRDRLTLDITLDALHRKGVCVLKSRENEIVFVECRRMIRDSKSLELNNKRQKRFNALNNEDLTPKKTEDRSQKTDKDSFVKSTTSQEPKPLTEIQKIVTVYKLVSGYPKEDRAWDKLNFARCAKSAKSLLEFMGNWKDAGDCIQDVYENLTAKGLTVTLETVVKHASNWKKDKQEKNRGVLSLPSNGSLPSN